MSKFQQQYAWQERFLPEVKTILGQHVLRIASMEEDQKRNTDMMVLKVDGLRIAVRVRKFEYLKSFGDEFTIRSEVASGAKTELAKILEGWGDWMFYAFADREERRIAAYTIGDLSVFRLWWGRHMFVADKPRPVAKPNGDGSKFFAFRIDEMPEGFVIERKRADALVGP